MALHREPKVLLEIQEICDDSNGRSQLFRSGSHGHLSCLRHNYESSSEDAWFSVEPGSSKDLAAIMQVISYYNTPFAVKSGGHSSNPGFSSTRGDGVQISMSRFNKLVFNKEKNQLTVGAGCLCDEIYKFIRPEKYNIVGGGGSVGIGGWLLGGGYSLKTNQYGLGIDNIIQAKIVLPNGSVVTATKDENSHLFWAIKGGGNNLGVVTEFILKTHPQGKNGDGLLYGGVLTFDLEAYGGFKQAIVEFMEKNDPKAAIVAAFRHHKDGGTLESKITVLAFYDEQRSEPGSLFQPFIDIEPRPKGELENSDYVTLDGSSSLLYEPVSSDLATTTIWSPASFPQKIAGLGVKSRARWGNVMVSKYTANLIDAIKEQAEEAKGLMVAYKGRMVVTDIWPFLPDMFKNSTDAAWPHTHSVPNGFTVVFFVWDSGDTPEKTEEIDDVWISQMEKALAAIKKVAQDEECAPKPDKNPLPVYCNTALAKITKPNDIYQDNLSDLSKLRGAYDPGNAMGLTGGFRVPVSQTIDNGKYYISNEDATVGVDQDTGEVREGSRDKFSIAVESKYYDRFQIFNEDHTRSIVVKDGKVLCVAGGTQVWKVIPASRKNKRFEYLIVDEEDTKKGLVLKFNGPNLIKRVEYVTIGRSPGKEALWSFGYNFVAS